MNEDIRKQLIRKLKKENAFWSYDVDSIKDVPLAIVTSGQCFV